MTNLIHASASISEGFEDLTAQAFAIWIRLHLTSDDELDSGRRGLAKKLGLKEATLNRILAELRRKGFIQIRRSENNRRRSRLILKRRAILKGRDRFIKLS
jgi:DNA-binding MarR family transcriptional regulator